MNTICTPTLQNCIKLFFKVWLFAFLLAFSSRASATIRYVKAGATGSGTSWSNASGDLQAMINASSSGDEVWVAQGNYRPASGVSYTMKEGVKIYGGYAGTGANPDDRYYGAVYVSTLQGNNAAVIDNNNNSLTAAARLDGFTITGGTNSGMRNISCSPTIANCIFSSNSAANGGGMYNYNYASPSLSNCIFRSNTTTGKGGGMYMEQYCSPRLLSCKFENNTASWPGGGMYIYMYSSPTLTVCDFTSNSTSDAGGGLGAYSNCTLSITGCTFTTNYADNLGGGVYNQANSSTFLNCTFTGNTARRNYGGGMYSSGGSLSVYGCTFKGNTASNGGGMYNRYLTNETVSNCLLSGNSVSQNGGGMYNEGMGGTFVILNCTISSNYGTYGGGIYNFYGSGYLRNSIVYGNNKSIDNDRAGLTIASSLVQAFNSSDIDPQFKNQLPPGKSTGGNYHLQPCSPFLDKGDNSFYPNTAYNDLDGNARFYNTKVDLGAFELQQQTFAQPNPATGVVYVKAGANGTGLSWSCPTGDLQAAIEGASSGNQVWVARGTYIPNRTAPLTSRVSPGDRDNAFVLKSGVKIYGGFAGSESSLSERNIANNITILSGDLNGDDNGFASNSDNAYHVVVSAGDVTTAVLDGFTIQGGNSDGGSAVDVNGESVGENGGGGIHCSNSSPTLTNLIIKGNAGRYGAGLSLSTSSPAIANSRIYGNAGYYGGGVIASNCGAAFTNVLISGNTAVEQGGGMYNEWAVVPTLTNVTIAGNTAANGGGAMYNNLAASLQVRNCIVYGNNTGIFNNSGSPAIQYSLVQGQTNTANGNISGSLDPRFVNAQTAGLSTSGDYNLLICSPAINTGSSTVYSNGQTPDLTAITTDLNTAARVQGTGVDMGAYEFTGGNNGNVGPADLLAINGDVASVTISGYTNLTATASACREVAGLLPRGVGSRALSGNVNAKVWVESVQPHQYVKRHYEITPVTNAAAATARVTLYFTQAEFDDFNAVNALKLPTGPTDAAGKANLLIEKRSGTSSNGTGSPDSYSGSIINIVPAGSDIVWNSAAGRWEITFSVYGFSGFFVKTQASALPLTLLSFTGSKQNGYNKLQWITADEVNTKYFALERSTDGRTFTPIATLSAAGAGNGTYSYNDNTAFNGKTYYRLKMADVDEQYTYSHIISLSNDDNSAMGLYPNPASDVITINTNNNTLLYSRAGLYDANGRLLQQVLITANSQTFNIQHLTNGLYMLKFANGATLKFIKK